MKDFAPRGKEPKDEVHIYTWQDTTLRELTDLVSQAHDMCSICPKDSCSITFHHFTLLPLFYYLALFWCTKTSTGFLTLSLKRRRGLECMWLAAGGSADEGGSTCSKEAGCTPLICICISRPVRTRFHLECRIIFCSRSLCLHFYLFDSQSFLGGCYLLLVFFFFWGGPYLPLTFSPMDTFSFVHTYWFFVICPGWVFILGSSFRSEIFLSLNSC